MTEKPKTKSQELQAQIDELKQWKTTLTAKEPIAAKAAENGKVQDSPDIALSPIVPSQPPPKPADKEEKHEHKKETGLEHYVNCPDCHKQINEAASKELFPLFQKQEREKVKGMKLPVVCEGCGEIVEGTEPKCPNCGGTKPRIFKF